MGTSKLAPTQRRARGDEWARRGAAAIAAAVGLAVVTLTLWRLRLGLDLTDESFYVAVPYHYTLGAVPFVDETSAQEITSGILAYPFVKVWTALNGVGGLVLFMRAVQFVISVLTAGVIAFSLRRELPSPVAVVIGLLAVAFVPFNLHALSYDTLTCYLLCCGLFLGFRGVQRGSRAEVCWAAGCLGLAVFAYPPLVLSVLLTLALWLATGSRSRRDALALTPALLIPLLGFGSLALSVGWRNIVSDYGDTARYFGEAGGPAKLWSIVSHWVTTLRPDSSPSASLQVVGHLGWLALPLYILVRRQPRVQVLLLTVWLPAWLAGVTTAYSSANGEANFGVGFFPAFIVMAVFLALAFESRLLRTATAGGVVGLLMIFMFAVYRDSSIGRLNSRIATGPFSGIVTTSSHRRFVDELQSDLSGLQPRCGILFFDDLPAGYLMSAARPATNSMWTQTVPKSRVGGYRRALLGYYRSFGLPQVAVMMVRGMFGEAMPQAATYIRRDPLVMLLRRRYRLGLRRPAYEIYVRHSSCRVG